MGNVVEFHRQDIEGDNPTYRYYKVGDKGLIFAILALFSWDYPCGKCHKLRLSPQGFATSCINQPPSLNLINVPMDEKVKIFESLIQERESKEFIACNRKHYRSQLGELRFGEYGNKKDANYYKTIINNHY